MFYDIWIPVDLFGQLLTGKCGADPAKRYSVRLSTRVNGTSSRLFPLLAVSVRLNAPLADSAFFLLTARTALPARRERRKINLSLYGGNAQERCDLPRRVFTLDETKLGIVIFSVIQ